ncbi:MAG TPA: hypothetical protein VM847_06095 [Tahibacter sp.]|nr:hypothetical protein [Tahibacter sp.]
MAIREPIATCRRSDPSFAGMCDNRGPLPRAHVATAVRSEGEEMTRATGVGLLLFMAIAAGRVEATPLVTPYATKQSTSYEGGYRLDLEVCGNVLCRLVLVLPHRRFRVPAETLRAIVDPDIRRAGLFVDPSGSSPGMVLVKLPVVDFDRQHWPMQEVFVVEFSDEGLKKIERVEQSAP